MKLTNYFGISGFFISCFIAISCTRSFDTQDVYMNVTSAHFSNNQLILSGTLLNEVTGLSLKQNSTDIPLTVAAKSTSQLVADLASSAMIRWGVPLSLTLTTATASSGIVLTVDLSGTTVTNFTSTGITDSAASTTMTLSSAGQVGIGTASPDGPLRVVSPSSSQIRFGISNSGGGVLTSMLANQASLAAGADNTGGTWTARSTAAAFMNVAAGSVIFYSNSGLTSGTTFTPTERIRMDTSGKLGIGTTPTQALDVAGNAAANHLVGRTTTPTSAAGTGAGTGPTITIGGTDMSGLISVTTGTSPASSAAVVTLTFASAYDTAPNCTVTANNAAASGYAYYTTTTTTTLILNIGSVGLSGSSLYKWMYTCIQ